jgi:cell wall-associated NlpC family hydrolase
MTMKTFFKKLAPSFSVITLVLLATMLTACGGSKRARTPYTYEYRAGRTAQLRSDGMAVAPPGAPAAVRRAIAAGNELQNKPYIRGGGHRVLYDRGYDCSGTVSYVLNKAGLMRGSMPSKGFMNYGRSGPGDWITVYAKNGHTFIVIAGLRLDTGGGRDERGPRWKTKRRETKGFYLRHPSGF